jgi:8-oxo-dGTP pyrophosphatase MutT (NUDIX family)
MVLEALMMINRISASDQKLPLLRPKDAASIVLYDLSQGETRFLFGKRRADLKFMPGQYVFPGGRRERSDARISTATQLGAVDQKRLEAGLLTGPNHNRTHALAVAGIREFFEETGMMLGNPNAKAALGFDPDLASLNFFARAITPPGNVRRFDTRFFIAPLAAIKHTLPKGAPDPEFDELRWASQSETNALILPDITRTILACALDWLSIRPQERLSLAVPTFRMRYGRFIREDIA